MIDTKKLYDICLNATRIVLSFLVLQFLNVVLFLIGLGIIFLPLMFLIDTICIQNIIFKRRFFDISLYIKEIKRNFFKSLVLLGTFSLLFVGINANIELVANTVSNDLSLIYYFIAIIASIFLILILILLIIYLPLVNATDKLNVLELLKISLIIPFVNLKVTFLLILMCIFSFVIITNNMLFFLLIGPNLLIACNIVIFHYYFKEKESGENKK